MLESCSRSISFSKGERDALGSMSERDLPFIGREGKISVQMERYGDFHTLLLGRLQSTDIENGYRRCTNHQSSILQSYNGCYAGNEGRWYDTRSPTDDVSESRLPERYRRHGRHACGRENGWYGIYDNTDDRRESIMNNSDLIDLLRRKRNWQSEKLRRMEDEFIARDWDNELFIEKSSFSHAETSSHEWIHAKCDFHHDGVLIGDTQMNHHRYKLTGERSSAKCINRNYSIVYRGEHDHSVPRCRDSLDLVVGEGKPSGRQSKGRSMMCNGRFQKIDLKLARAPRSTKDFHESDRGKAFRSDVSKLESNENNSRLNKFSVTEHNKDLGIEKSEITMEEQSISNLSEKEHVFERIVPTCNVKKSIARSGNPSSENNKIGREIDNQRILQTLAKMEKRRERVKDHIAPKQEPEKNPEPQADLMVDIAETRQQRPARKRRWPGS